MKTKIVLGFLTLCVLAADGAILYRDLFQLKGTSFDFYLVWVGTKEFWQGGNPYTDQIAKQIQIGMLGHVAAPAENQYYFVYPAYLALLILPFPLLPFIWSVTGWLILQQILLVIVLVLVFRTLAWKPSPRGTLVVVAACVTFRYIWIALVLAQTSILILFLFAIAGYASWCRREEWAAVALAAATIKPQLAILPILGWFVITVAQRQLRAVIVFFATLLVLFVLTFLVVGNWLAGFIRAVILYAGYNRAESSLTLMTSLLPNGLAWAIVVASVVLVSVGYLLWTARHRKNLTTVLNLSILLTLVLIPLPSVYDISLVLLPWLVCWRAFTDKRDWSARTIVALLGVMPILSWTIITILPVIFDRLGWPFDVVVADKILIPMLLLAVFIYAERTGVMGGRDALQEMRSDAV